MTRFACVQHDIVLNAGTSCLVGRIIATVVQIPFATGRRQHFSYETEYITAVAVRVTGFVAFDALVVC